MKRDPILTELSEIKNILKGISPKLSTYTKLKAREKVLLDMLGGQSVQPIYKNKIDKIIK